MAREQPTPPNHPDEVLDLRDLARLLRLGSAKTAKRAFDDGELPVPSFYIRGQPRWLWSNLRRWLRGYHLMPEMQPAKAGQTGTETPKPGQKRPNRDTGQNDH